jgi:hypothetical protein
MCDAMRTDVSRRPASCSSEHRPNAPVDTWRDQGERARADQRPDRDVAAELTQVLIAHDRDHGDHRDGQKEGGGDDRSLGAGALAGEQDAGDVGERDERDSDRHRHPVGQEVGFAEQPERERVQRDLAHDDDGDERPVDERPEPAPRRLRGRRRRRRSRDAFRSRRDLVVTVRPVRWRIEHGDLRPSALGPRGAAVLGGGALRGRAPGRRGRDVLEHRRGVELRLEPSETFVVDRGPAFVLGDRSVAFERHEPDPLVQRGELLARLADLDLEAALAFALVGDEPGYEGVVTRRDRLELEGRRVLLEARDPGLAVLRSGASSSAQFRTGEEPHVWTSVHPFVLRRGPRRGETNRFDREGTDRL